MIESYIEQQHPDLILHKKLLCELFAEKSFSDIERTFNLSRKEAFIKDQPLVNILLGKNQPLENMSNVSENRISKTDRNELVHELFKKGLSQRKIAEETGLSRPTVKKIITTLQTIEST